MSAADRWIVCPRPNPSARLRLFCLPYAGGSALVFRDWARLLPASIEVCAVEFPGRGRRFSERPAAAMEPLVGAIVDALGARLDRPFAFFGHSMGALVGFEVSRLLRRRLGRVPERFIVSAARAPHLPRRLPDVHRLPDRELLERMRVLDGTPPVVLETPELMELMLPVIRADFAVCETYDYRVDAPLDCPISAFGGPEDPLVSRTCLEAWRGHTTGAFSLRMLQGGHFFLNTEQAALLAMLGAELTPPG